MNREKAIEILSHYTQTVFGDKEDGITVSEIIELLKECEPRVLSLEEAIEATFVWLEAGCSIIPAIRTPGHPDYICFGAFRGEHVCDLFGLKKDYLISFRCWNVKPSKEQVEAVEWKWGRMECS